MAEALKTHFGVEIPSRIAEMLARAFPAFDQSSFVSDCRDGYDELELLARGWKIARVLRRHLPADYEAAAAILLDSLGPKLDRTGDFGMEAFLYLPHVFFVAEYGLDHFETSMRAQYELTQRFSAEFSIRRFLEQHPAATIDRLALWANDPSPHVRRLVSEGTRPRLPWAPRLRAFQSNPRPVLALLELLKDDPELYVRRSVANNLNDIGKDHPSLLAETARRWLRDATDERRWLIRHALRSALKRAEPEALALMGYGDAARVAIGNVNITPRRAKIGGAVTIAFDISDAGSRSQQLLVDCRIHFVKANGGSNPKVFKLKVADLAAKQAITLSKTISLADMTTRRHYPGMHKVDIVINGSVWELGQFEIVRS